MAVGLFNRGLRDAKMTVKWSELGLTGRQMVRDLWLHKDVGEFTGSFSARVPSHGALLIKVGRPKM